MLSTTLQETMSRLCPLDRLLVQVRDAHLVLLYGQHPWCAVGAAARAAIAGARLSPVGSPRMDPRVAWCRRAPDVALRASHCAPLSGRLAERDRVSSTDPVEGRSHALLRPASKVLSRSRGEARWVSKVGSARPFGELSGSAQSTTKQRERASPLTAPGPRCLPLWGGGRSASVVRMLCVRCIASTSSLGACPPKQAGPSSCAESEARAQALASEMDHGLCKSTALGRSDVLLSPEAVHSGPTARRPHHADWPPLEPCLTRLGVVAMVRRSPWTSVVMKRALHFRRPLCSTLEQSRRTRAVASCPMLSCLVRWLSCLGCGWAASAQTSPMGHTPQDRPLSQAIYTEASSPTPASSDSRLDRSVLAHKVPCQSLGFRDG